MRTVVAVILNLPWSLLALCAALFSLPRSVSICRAPFAIVVHIGSFWWKRAQGVRATTAGSVILCGPSLEAHDIEHELIHVEQYYREPFVHPFLYLYQSWKYGYQANKYEVEAYRRAGNRYNIEEV